MNDIKNNDWINYAIIHMHNYFKGFDFVDITSEKVINIIRRDPGTWIYCMLPYCIVSIDPSVKVTLKEIVPNYEQKQTTFTFDIEYQIMDECICLCENSKVKVILELKVGTRYDTYN